ncbi:hypothetical protein FNH22_14965 [Fulvivirga sp. M361]|uniref:hypothetical protein n=1 Tax=Fulvivirga sp. M361 TaxID=2594266 RepID=UPI001179C7D2|nr:hypothetical protein [Fulvivirga sp. M361]TRX57710.1 hypothetical protein FNH22_14965 [Fulvivirga sp. M361]
MKYLSIHLVLMLFEAAVYGQSSVNEASGLWIDGSSWVGGAAPVTSAANLQNITIDGFIRREGDITSTSNFGLTVQSGDTLIITGGLNIQNGNLSIESGGVAVVGGDTNGFGNFNININGGDLVLAGAVTNINFVTTNGNGHFYVFDPTPNISGNVNGSNGQETENDLLNNNPDLFSLVTGQVLPVELTLFTATGEAREIILNWRTASEWNNDYFEVQRSDNGLDFSEIGLVGGSGTVQETISYQFIDTSPLNGINYYRLKQYDFDGAFEYSPVIRSFFDTNRTGIHVFPNPAAEQLQITLDDRFINTNVRLELYDSKGMVIMWDDFLPTTPLSTIGLESIVVSGLHLLRLTNGSFEEFDRVLISK